MMRLNFRQRLSGFALLAACTVLASSGARVVSQTTASHTPDGPFLMEKLGRGLVAVRTTPTEIYLSWRLLANRS